MTCFDRIVNKFLRYGCKRVTKAVSDRLTGSSSCRVGVLIVTIILSPLGLRARQGKPGATKSCLALTAIEIGLSQKISVFPQSDAVALQQDSKLTKSIKLEGRFVVVTFKSPFWSWLLISPSLSRGRPLSQSKISRPLHAASSDNRPVVETVRCTEPRVIYDSSLETERGGRWIAF